MDMCLVYVIDQTNKVMDGIDRLQYFLFTLGYFIGKARSVLLHDACHLSAKELAPFVHMQCPHLLSSWGKCPDLLYIRVLVGSSVYTNHLAWCCEK